MIERIVPHEFPNYSGGLVTLPNLLALQPTQSPNCMDVKYSVGPILEKRLGTATLNAVILVSSAATGFAPDSSGSLSTSLQAFWKLNEQTGTRLDSFSTNHLTDNNTAGFAVGILGNALATDTTNGAYLSLSDNAAMSMGDIDFSVSAWVYLTATNEACVVGKGNANVASGAEYLLRYLPGVTNRFQFIVGNSLAQGTVNGDSLGAANTATWYHLVGRHDATANLMYLHINNGAANSASYTSGSYDSSYELTVGRYPVANDAFVQGRVDEVGVWKKLLAAQEVTDLYNAGAANSYNSGASNSGWGAFDFGASAGADGKPLRWLTVAAGTGIYASSNRGVTFVVVATDRRTDFQEFERSKTYLIAVSNTQQAVLYWAGSANTFMSALAPNSAPAAKHALNFQGWLLLMNYPADKRGVAYADENKITTDPWTTTFSLPSSFDDEITGGALLNRMAYVSTKYTMQRISTVGGNPDFAYQKVTSWGYVPRTIKNVTLPHLGEVLIGLCWDRKIRIFDGSLSQVVSDPIEFSNGLAPAYLQNVNQTQLLQSHAEVDTEEQVYRLWLTMSPSTQTTHCFSLNLRTFAWYPPFVQQATWYPYANQIFNAAVMAESGNTRILTAVGRNGYVYQLNTGNTDAGTAIPDFFQSSYIFGKTPREITKEQKLDLYFAATSSGTLYLEDHSDFSQTFRLRDTIPMVAVGASTLYTKVIDIPATVNVYQYRLSSSASTATPWKLLRTDLNGTPLGYGKAG